MEFIVSEPQSELEKFLGGYLYINAFGTIRPGDDKKFESIVKKAMLPPRVTLYLDSTGGDVDAAIGIGRIIREHWFSCTVGRYVITDGFSEVSITPRKLLPGKCLSAATLIYIGGRLRHFSEDSVFGVHQFSFKDPTPEHIGKSQQLSTKISSYVSDMGLSQRFLEISSATAAASITKLERQHLEDLGVITGGETEADWSAQARNNILYIRGERDSIYGHHKVMLGFGKDSGFIFWAVIEAQGRDEELTKYGLVEVVINGEEKRIDISSRCNRVVSGAYVNVIAKISENEAKTIAYSNSFGVQVRPSKEAPVFYGVSAVSTEGGSDKLQTFFNILKK